MCRLKKIIFLSVFCVCLNISPAFSGASKYFNVTLRGGVNALALAKKLNVNSFRHVEAVSDEDMGSMAALERALDALFLEVSDSLDIHIYTLKINLEIFPSSEFVNREILNCGRKVGNMPAFYYYEKNTIYASAADLRAGMLAHEVAHAIISHYFVIPPPERAQEILCGYAEFSINKLSGN